MDNTAPWAAAASEAPPARATFIRVASVAFFATTAVFWLVLLGGIGKSSTLEGLCTGGATGNVGSCGNDLSKAWWILALELFCIIGAAMLASGSPLVSRFSHTLLAVWTIETTLLMVAAADFVIPAYYATGDLGQGLRTASAGAVVLCIMNLVWLLCETDKERKLSMQLPAFSCSGRARLREAEEAGAKGAHEQQMPVSTPAGHMHVPPQQYGQYQPGRGAGDMAPAPFRPEAQV
ncbi:hypothetical protein V8C86DRAFT_2577467 [Haematococcus lacustris]